MFANRGSRKGGRTFPSHAKTEREQGVGKVSTWVRRVGWRVYIANGIGNLRRSPRVGWVNGKKEKQEQIRAWKGKGSEIRKKTKQGGREEKKTEREKKTKGKRRMIREGSRDRTWNVF